jgi:hypothetical protein
MWREEIQSQGSKKITGVSQTRCWEGLAKNNKPERKLNAGILEGLGN